MCVWVVYLSLHELLLARHGLEARREVVHKALAVLVAVDGRDAVLVLAQHRRLDELLGNLRIAHV